MKNYIEMIYGRYIIVLIWTLQKELWFWPFHIKFLDVFQQCLVFSYLKVCFKIMFVWQFLPELCSSSANKQHSCSLTPGFQLESLSIIFPRLWRCLFGWLSQRIIRFLSLLLPMSQNWFLPAVFGKTVGTGTGSNCPAGSSSDWDLTEAAWRCHDWTSNCFQWEL